MATNTITLKKKIETLKKGLNNKFVSASQKEKIKSQVEKLEKQVKASKQAKAPKGSSLTRLQKLVNKKKFSVYQGKGIDLKKDADQGALAVGRRVSKGIKGNQFGDAKSSKGNVYYEYRANRLDVKQPKKAQKYPKLEKGGMMAKGGELKVSTYHLMPLVMTNDKMMTPKYDYKITFEGTEDEALAKAKDMLNKEVVNVHVSLINPNAKSLLNRIKTIAVVKDKMAQGGVIDVEDRYTIYGTSDEGWFAVDKETKRQIHPSQFGRNSWETKQELLADLKSKNMAKGGTLVRAEYNYGGNIEENKLMIKDLIMPYKDNKNAQWVEVTYFGDGFQYSRGVSIDLVGSRDKAIELAKKQIQEEIKKGKLEEGGYMAKGGGVLSNYRLTFMNDNGEKKYMTTESYNKAGAMKEGKWWEKNPDYNIAKGNYKVVSVVEVEEDEDDDKDTSSYKIRNERRRGIRGKGVTYNSDYSSYPNVFNPLGKPRYEEGGSIPNNYKGKTANEIWDEWTFEQKRHFLEDHYDEIEKYGGLTRGKSLRSVAESTYNDLPTNVKQVLEDHIETGQYAKGGVTEKEVVESNAEMVLSQIKAVKHHAEELSRVVSTKSKIEAWVVGKIERASTDLSDITHYLEGNKDKMSMGGTVRYYTHKMDK